MRSTDQIINKNMLVTPNSNTRYTSNTTANLPNKARIKLSFLDGESGVSFGYYYSLVGLLLEANMYDNP